MNGEQSAMGWATRPKARPAIIICLNRRDGLEWAQRLAHPTDTYLYLSPRSPHGVRGRTCLGLHVTEAMRDHPMLERLKKEAEPALATWGR